MDKRVEKISSARDAIEIRILDSATQVFAESGFHGSSLAGIAECAGISKQNLLYYFANKQVLYQKVLDQILDQWLERMDFLATSDEEPEQLLRQYIHAKLRFSKEQPQASRVYAMEVIGGAAVHSQQMREKILPLFKKDIATFENWIAAGKIKAVNATHLLFSIWAMTQSYADFATQMNLVLAQESLSEQDFDDAEEFIVGMVLHRLRAS